MIDDMIIMYMIESIIIILIGGFFIALVCMIKLWLKVFGVIKND